MINNFRRDGKARARIGSVLTLTAIVLLGGAAATTRSTAAEVNETRAVLEQWVEIRRVISKEKRDLKLSEEMLNERIALVQREIDSLRTKIADAEKSIADADKKRTEMMAENEALKEGTASLAGSIATLEARATELLARVPEPLRQRVKPLTQRFPEKPDETKLTVSERFQNVLGVLNEVSKFNGETTVTSEVRTLPDGASVEVTAMYLGIGYAYYAGANDTVAGIGVATDAGWTWTPMNEAAGQIAKAIAVLKNEQVASFVQLPLTVD